MSFSTAASAMEYWSYVAAITASIAVVVVSFSGVIKSMKWLKERHIDRSERHRERKAKLSIRILSLLYRIQSKMVMVRLPYKFASISEIESAKSNLRQFGLSDSQIEDQEDKLKAQVFVNRFSTIEENRHKISKLIPKIQIILGDNARKEIDEFSSFLSLLKIDAMDIIFENSNAKPVDHLFSDFENEKISDDIGSEIHDRVKKIEKILTLN